MSEIQIEPGGVSTSSGTGTITGVFASDGLSGGATTGNATLEINHSYQNTFLSSSVYYVSDLLLMLCMQNRQELTEKRYTDTLSTLLELLDTFMLRMVLLPIWCVQGRH